MTVFRVSPLVLAVLLATAIAAMAGLKVKDFDAADATDVRLDQALTFDFRGRVKAKHVDPATIRIRTASGNVPRGTLIQGRPWFDAGSGTTVTIDPDQIGPRALQKAMRKGRLDPWIPHVIRYDLGAVSPLNGFRQVLIDQSDRSIVTFLPEVPMQADLSDVAFEPGETYIVEVVKKGGKKVVYSSSFTVVSQDDPHLFIGEVGNAPRVVNVLPRNRDPIDFMVRFSTPLDPRTVAGGLEVHRIGDDEEAVLLPSSAFLWQARMHTVEVRVRLEEQLPPGTQLRLSLTGTLTDLPGRRVESFVFDYTVPE